MTSIWCIVGDSDCLGAYCDEEKANDALNDLYSNGYFGDLEVQEVELEGIL